MASGIKDAGCMYACACVRARVEAVVGAANHARRGKRLSRPRESPRTARRPLQASRPAALRLDSTPSGPLTHATGSARNNRPDKPSPDASPRRTVMKTIAAGGLHHDLVHEHDRDAHKDVAAPAEHIVRVQSARDAHRGRRPAADAAKAHDPATSEKMTRRKQAARVRKARAGEKRAETRTGAAPRATGEAPEELGAGGRERAGAERRPVGGEPGGGKEARKGSGGRAESSGVGGRDARPARQRAGARARAERPRELLTRRSGRSRCQKDETRLGMRSSSRGVCCLRARHAIRARTVAAIRLRIARVAPSAPDPASLFDLRPSTHAPLPPASLSPPPTSLRCPACRSCSTAPPLRRTLTPPLRLPHKLPDPHVLLHRCPCGRPSRPPRFFFVWCKCTARVDRAMIGSVRFPSRLS